MAGNSRSGRKPDPRKRIGEKANILKLHVTGVPQCPDDLSDEAKWMWEFVVPELTTLGIVGEIDTAELWSLCELWGLYRQSVECAKNDPTDKNARIAVTSYKAAFETVAVKFGMNPADRLKFEKPPEVNQDFDEFIAKHA